MFSIGAKFFLKICFFIIVGIFFNACLHGANQKIARNPLYGIIGSKDNTDPLNIGEYPTLPQENIDGKPIVGQILLPDEQKKIFNLQVSQLTENNLQPPLLQSTPNTNDLSTQGDWMTLMHPTGSVLTIWALAQGNWIWGYSLIDSIGFGGARVWKFLFLENDEVMIQNAKTNTCLNGYKNGLIHMACRKNNLYQRFKLIPMSNGAFMFKNVGFDKCIHAPIGNIFGDFHKVNGIFLSPCASGDNIDQQWYIAPPPLLIHPLYDKTRN